MLYLTITTKNKNRSNPEGRIADWTNILNVLAIHYGDRFPTN